MRIFISGGAGFIGSHLAEFFFESRFFGQSLRQSFVGQKRAFEKSDRPQKL